MSLSYPRLLWSCLCAATAISGQTLSVSSTAAQPGTIAVAEIVLRNPTPDAARISTLEWVMTYAAQDLLPKGSGPSISPNARSAGKILGCSGGWKKAPTRYSYHCLLTGGAGVVPDGPVATVAFEVGSDAKNGDRTIEIDRIVAVDAAAKSIKMNKVNGRILISPKGSK